MSLLEKTLKAMEKPEKIKIEDSKPPKVLKIPKPIDKKQDLGAIQQIAMELVNDWDFIKGLGRSIKKVFPEQFKGINLRTSNKKIVEQFDKRIKDINKTYDIVEQLKHDKTGDYKIVMNELNLKLAKQKEKIENDSN